MKRGSANIMVRRGGKISNTCSHRFCETTAAIFPDVFEAGVSLCEKPLVRVERLELPRLAAPEPKSGVSTNFTIPADDHALN